MILLKKFGTPIILITICYNLYFRSHLQKASNNFIQFKLARNVTVNGTIRNSKFFNTIARVWAEDLLQFKRTNLLSFSNQSRKRKPRSMDGKTFLTLLHG